MVVQAFWAAGAGLRSPPLLCSPPTRVSGYQSSANTRLKWEWAAESRPTRLELDGWPHSAASRMRAAHSSCCRRLFQSSRLQPSLVSLPPLPPIMHRTQRELVEPWGFCADHTLFAALKSPTGRMCSRVFELDGAVFSIGADMPQDSSEVGFCCIGQRSRQGTFSSTDVRNATSSEESSLHKLARQW